MPSVTLVSVDVPAVEATKAPAVPASGTVADAVSVLPWVLALVLLVVAVVACIGWWSAVRRARHDAPSSAARPIAADDQAARIDGPVDTPAPTPPAATVDPRIVTDLITLRELSDSPSIRAQVADVLARLDVSVVQPEIGSEFDPVTQHAAEARPTDDESAVHTIAEVVRSGYRTPSGTIRPVDVVVWVDRSPEGAS